MKKNSIMFQKALKCKRFSDFSSCVEHGKIYYTENMQINLSTLSNVIINKKNNTIEMESEWYNNFLGIKEREEKILYTYNWKDYETFVKDLKFLKNIFNITDMFNDLFEIVSVYNIKSVEINKHPITINNYVIEIDYESNAPCIVKSNTFKFSFDKSLYEEYLFVKDIIINYSDGWRV